MNALPSSNWDHHDRLDLIAKIVRRLQSARPGRQSLSRNAELDRIQMLATESVETLESERSYLLNASDTRKSAKAERKALQASLA